MMTNCEELIKLSGYVDLYLEVQRLGYKSVQSGTGLQPIGSANGTILLAIILYGPLPMSQLAQRTHKTKANVSAAVKALESMGLVMRTTASSDGRVVLVSITERGKAYSAIFETISSLLTGCAFQNLSNREKQLFFKLLGKICENLSHFREPL